MSKAFAQKATACLQGRFSDPGCRSATGVALRSLFLGNCPIMSPNAQTPAGGRLAAPALPFSRDAERERLLRGLARLSKLREEMLDLAARLVDQLDAIDGDPDLEETGDLEPSLAAPEGEQHYTTGFGGGTDDEREADYQRWAGQLDFMILHQLGGLGGVADAEPETAM